MSKLGKRIYGSELQLKSLWYQYIYISNKYILTKKGGLTFKFSETDKGMILPARVIPRPRDWCGALSPPGRPTNPGPWEVPGSPSLCPTEGWKRKQTLTYTMSVGNKSINTSNKCFIALKINYIHYSNYRLLHMKLPVPMSTLGTFLNELIIRAPSHWTTLCINGKIGDISEHGF